jgi:hypothetical protein
MIAAAMLGFVRFSIPAIRGNPHFVPILNFSGHSRPITAVILSGPILPKDHLADRRRPVRSRAETRAAGDAPQVWRQVPFRRILSLHSDGFETGFDRFSGPTIAAAMLSFVKFSIPAIRGNPHFVPILNFSGPGRP